MPEYALLVPCPGVCRSVLSQATKAAAKAEHEAIRTAGPHEQFGRVRGFDGRSVTSWRDANGLTRTLVSRNILTTGREHVLVSKKAPRVREGESLSVA
jgi:hypothetical protein